MNDLGLNSGNQSMNVNEEGEKCRSIQGMPNRKEAKEKKIGKTRKRSDRGRRL